ncbi:hypothetical protein HRH25_21765 [Flavisolibacter sp. BT320]|nr:hypothetical protein [Flavisolibacter longurius]
MDNTDELKQRYPHCEVTSKPHLFSHVAEEDMPFFCSGIQQGRPQDGMLSKGEKVVVKTNDDPHRPWIVNKDGIVAQVQGKLRSIPL